MPVDHQADPGNPPPSLRPHYRASSLLRDGPSLRPTPVLDPLQFPLLGVLPSAGRSNTRPAPTGRGVPTFGAAPAPSSRRLCAGHHLANKQAPARLIPGQQLDPGFDAVDTLSTLPQRFTHVRLPGSHLTPHRRLFRNAHHPGSFTRAACGGLGSPPAGRPRRANLHHQHRTASRRSRPSTSQPPSAFVAHDHPHVVPPRSCGYWGGVRCRRTELFDQPPGR